MKYNSKRVFAVVTITFVLASCDSTEPKPESDIHENGIEDIFFGMTPPEVRAIAGTPNTYGIIDGTYRNWSAITYSSGRFAGVRFQFEEILSEPEETWPLDALVLEYPYSGTLPGGVRIGTHQSEVIREYGQPLDRVELAGSDQRIQFCLCDHDLTIQVSADTVEFVFWAFNTPIPEVTNC